jgi:hypothetical protein
MVASWYCVTRAERQPRWGAPAGAFATLAFFTMAAAAAYVGALGLLVVLDLRPALSRVEGPEGRSYLAALASALRRHLWIVAGLGLSFALVVLFFVLPHWTDYRFYNWQMSVTRKPSYDLASLVTRVTWLPILHDTFSRMWGALLLAVAGAWTAVAGWRRADTAERLLVLWLAVGAVELLVHDVGNERRLVFLIPALVGLASIVLARGSLVAGEVPGVSRGRVLLAAPLIGYSIYVLLAPVIRVFYLEAVYSGLLKMPVRLSAAGAVVLTAALVAAWPRASRLLAARWGQGPATAAVAAAVVWNLAQFADWAAHRTYKNYDASVAIGRALPPGTPIQGKLANGLALDNAIRPLFIGHGFGNYEDRKVREDVRYILTYTDPEIGHEGDQIVDVLAAYPGWRIIMTFPVAETPSGHDLAALIEKRARH